MANDLGAPPGYARANVLISEDYRYFAAARPADYRAGHPNLARMIDRLGQGHRVNIAERERNELERYLARLWT